MCSPENLTKIYKNKIKALENINLTINKGEKVTIFGPNGAGKTTLIKTIGMFIIPDRGKIKIKGYDTQKDDYVIEIKQKNKNKNISVDIIIM
nr:ATP-binding cassette domain-containing protein [Marinitoga sp. 1155]